MEDNKLEAVMAALLAPAVSEKEEYTNDEDCGFVSSDPDRVDEYGNERNEDEFDDYDYDDYDYDEDSEYDNWVDDTYSCYDEGRQVEELASRLQTIAETIQNDDYRYRIDEANRVEDLVNDLEDLINKLDDAANNYSTF